MSRRTLRVGILALVVSVLAIQARPAFPSLVTFNATGVPGVAGFVQFDDSTFTGGTFDFILNSQIVDLSMTVFGETFDLADVVTSAYTLIDSSHASPILINGAGLLADNGSMRIFFYPDGANGTPSDGDAALAFFSSDFSFTVLPVHWVVGGAVSEPGSIVLVALGFLAFALSSRRFRGAERLRFRSARRQWPRAG